MVVLTKNILLPRKSDYNLKRFSHFSGLDGDSTANCIFFMLKSPCIRIGFAMHFSHLPWSRNELANNSKFLN